MAADAAPRVTVPVPPDRVERDPERLRWGTVSTIKAPLLAIARFAAWHLEAGAAEIHIYLDAPDPVTAGFFAGHPAIRVTQCDAAYWRGKPARAQRAHQLRQAYNASRAYRRAGVHWLAHVDVDEFLLSPRPLAQVLAAVPAEAAYARMRPAEMLAQPDPWTGETAFKLTRREAGQTKAALARIYPGFGEYVPEGFIGYNGGKNFARTGLPGIRLGIHALLQDGVAVANGQMLDRVHVGHAHAPDWDTFQRHFRFRMTHGSYRKNPDDPMRLRDVLDLVIAAEGSAGLRRFFDTMCAATPDLLARLDAHGMLLTARLDLDAKVAKWFGRLPQQDTAS